MSTEQMSRKATNEMREAMLDYIFDLERYCDIEDRENFIDTLFDSLDAAVAAAPGNFVHSEVIENLKELCKATHNVLIDFYPSEGKPGHEDAKRAGEILKFFFPFYLVKGELNPNE